MESRRIYHITHIENLPSILAEAGLWSDAQRLARKLSTTNIGHAHIKERRLRRAVSCAARGMLGDYVPFNFCSRSVMLYVIHRGSVQGYDGGQEPIIHLVSSVGTALSCGQPWTFTNRHAELAYAEYFDSLDDEDRVDWSVMPLTYWAGSEETKEKRQAEFLVHEWFPLESIEEIGVMSKAVGQQVKKVLAGSGFNPRVLLKPSWYY
jgi:hypothetical protein